MTKAEKMVMVPREVAEAAWQALDDDGRFEESCPLRRALDQPAQQHQGEPVALPVRAPVAPIPGAYTQRGHNMGWNACLDEIAKLGPLYTHADPAEVERLRAENADYGRQVVRYEQLWIDARKERDTLRAQLAEAHALLRRWDGKLGHLGGCATPLRDETKAALYASAEQSAPVEIDERTEFCEGQWWLAELDRLAEPGTADQRRAVAVVRNMMRQLFQARAALESKP